MDKDVLFSLTEQKEEIVMQEVFEKIIKNLKEEKSNVPVNRLLDDVINDKPKELGQLMAYRKAIEIVNRATAEYNNGWIPCSERLPEEGEKVLVWYEYFRYGEYNTMFQTFGIGYQFDGFWSGDVNGTKAKCIAWQPLPEPYQPKGE